MAPCSRDAHLHRNPQCDGEVDPISADAIPDGEGFCVQATCFSADTLHRLARNGRWSTTNPCSMRDWQAETTHLKALLPPPPPASPEPVYTDWEDYAAEAMQIRFGEDLDVAARTRVLRMDGANDAMLAEVARSRLLATPLYNRTMPPNPPQSAAQEQSRLLGYGDALDYETGLRVRQNRLVGLPDNAPMETWAAVVRERTANLPPMDPEENHEDWWNYLDIVDLYTRGPF